MIKSIFRQNYFTSLPNDEILESSKLKALADNRTFQMKRYKTLWEKGRNASYQHFTPFHITLSKAIFFRVLKSRDCVVNG